MVVTFSCSNTKMRHRSRAATLISKKRLAREQRAGFTLLELLVVMLLVSLLSALLMQGFIFLSSVYSSVHRKQVSEQTRQLTEGWLRDSVKSLVNGVDAPSASQRVFLGDAQRFDGIALRSLHGLPGPINISWRLENTGESLQVFYGEAPLGGAITNWILVREWPFASGYWVYGEGGQWLAQFPPAKGLQHLKLQPVLPETIALIVDGDNNQTSVIVALDSNKWPYQPPKIQGVL